MDRFSLAFARVCFFLMLFVSTACNKMDSSLHRDSLADQAPTAPASATGADIVRLRELEARMAVMEAQLQLAKRDALAFHEVPGGVTWD